MKLIPNTSKTPFWPLLWLSSLLTLSACSSLPDTSQAFHVQVHHADGTASPPNGISAADLERHLKQGAVIHLLADDELALELNIDSELITLVSGVNAPRLKFRQDTWFYTSDKGVFLSFDGKNYQPFEDAIKGELNLQLGVAETRKANIVSISVAAHAR